MKLLKRDDIAHELKLELIELLKELTIKVEKCDERDQYFFSEQHKKQWAMERLPYLQWQRFMEW